MTGSGVEPDSVEVVEVALVRGIQFRLRWPLPHGEILDEISRFPCCFHNGFECGARCVLIAITPSVQVGGC